MMNDLPFSLRKQLAVVSSRFGHASVLCAALACLLAGCSRDKHQAAHAAPIPPPPPVQFVAAWGAPGEGPGQLSDPAGPAVDAIGRVYFADRGSGFLQKFELNGVPLLSFESASLRRADSIAVDSGGAIYVANMRAGDIQVFFPQGPLLRVLRVAPQRGPEEPFQFSIDAEGEIFVPDAAGGRVQVLNANGRLERAWKVAPAANDKAAHPVAAIAGEDGSVYVADTAGGRILKFTSQGQQTAEWGDSADTAGPLLGLAVSAKNVFALHAGSPRLTVWTLDGQNVLTDELDEHAGAAPSSHSSFAVTPAGDVIVLDSDVPRVLHFRVRLDAR